MKIRFPLFKAMKWQVNKFSGAIFIIQSGYNDTEIANLVYILSYTPISQVTYIIFFLGTVTVNKVSMFLQQQSLWCICFNGHIFNWSALKQPTNIFYNDLLMKTTLQVLVSGNKVGRRLVVLRPLCWSYSHPPGLNQKYRTYYHDYIFWCQMKAHIFLIITQNFSFKCNMSVNVMVGYSKR